MDVFQTPVEGLITFNFNYLSSFGSLAASFQSLFTCVAILTAAITFWRFTTVASNSFRLRTKSSPSGNFDGHSSTPPPPPPPLLHVSPPLALQRPSIHHHQGDHDQSFTCNYVGRRSSSSFVGPIPIEDDDNGGNGEKRMRKAKFTLYYSSELADNEEDEDTNTIPLEGVDVICSSGPPEIVHSNGRWYSDGISARRGGDFVSWYNYQDLTVLNGSIVRLWESCHRRRNAPFPCLPPGPGLQVIV